MESGEQDADPHREPRDALSAQFDAAEALLKEIQAETAAVRLAVEEQKEQVDKATKDVQAVVKEMRDGETKTRILSLLNGGSFKGFPSTSIVPQLVAWTNQPFQDVTVNGVRPHAHSETAVAVTLPVEQVGAGVLPTGLVSGRIVDFVGDTTQQGPPGTLMIQNGTVTYSFIAPLATGLHLTGASISSSNPYLGKSPAAAGNQAPSTSGEAWDWSHSSWVDIGYKDNGTTDLPDSVVNPTSGEIRLRVTTNNGSCLAGGITLTGTVQ